MRDARVADGEEDKCDPMQYADPADTTLSELLIAAPPSYGYPWVIRCDANLTLGDLPNEVLLHILSYLDVCDLLATSRVSACRAIVVLLQEREKKRTKKDDNGKKKKEKTFCMISVPILRCNTK